MKILITGCCGFIGYHLAITLLKNKKYKIYCIDNINDYYDLNLKKNRLKNLKSVERFNFMKIDLKNSLKVEEIFRKNKFGIVIHLAAQTGVSIQLNFLGHT